MLRVGKWVAAIGLALVVVGWAVTFFGPPGLVPSVLGTGGFTTRVVTDVPHPFTFDRPRLWEDRTGELHRLAEVWDVMITGPQTDVGITFTTLSIEIRPDASRAVEYPVPGGPYLSLEDFTRRHLPSDKKMVTENTAIVQGRPARDVTYDYVVYLPTQGASPPSVNSRGRAVFFDDRGYYYKISYGTRDVEYDRYVDVFERAVKTFRFLD